MNEEEKKQEENIINNVSEKPQEADESTKETEKDEKQHAKEHKKKKGSKSEKEINEEWQAKYNELNDRFLRLYAEFENYRKRALTERLELIRNASEDVIKQLLPIVDDYERALKASNEISDFQTLKEGTELIYSKIKTLLEQKKVKEIIALGEVFNTDFHEAVTTIPAPTEDMKGKVIEEVQKGYTINDKVIRYSKVIVAS